MSDDGLSPARARQLRLAAPLLIACLGGLLYAPHLGHDFVTDDAIYIVENPAVVHGAPLAAYFTDRATIASNPDFHWQSYRPLRTLAFRLLAVLGGVNPVSYGFVNLILYIATAMLVFKLALRFGHPLSAALWATLLWVAAPVHVEPVLYASALGDHLSLLLMLGALWLILDTLEGQRLPVGRAVVAWLMVVAALLTKEMAVTMPLLIALCAWVTGAWRRQPRRAALLVLAHGAAVLGYLVVRTRVLGAFGHGELTAQGAIQQAALAPLRLGAYLRIVVAPLGHSAAYVLPVPALVFVFASWAILAAVIMLLVRTSPLTRFGWAWFVACLTPVLGIVPLFADLADRFALFPSVGLAWVVPAAIAVLARAWRPLARLAPALLLAAFAAGTVVESEAWSDELALWSKAVVLQPRSSQAQRNLGTILLQRGEPGKALAHFDEARALGENAGELDRRRAMALEALGRVGDAESAVVTALARDPNLATAHALYGGLLLRRGVLAAAEAELSQARALAPTHPSSLLLEAEIAMARRDFARALAAENQLVARYPAEPRFHFKRAQTLFAARDAGAIGSARECLRLAPAHPQCACLLGRALVATGQRGAEADAALATGLAKLPPGPERTACERARWP